MNDARGRGKYWRRAGDRGFRYDIYGLWRTTAKASTPCLWTGRAIYSLERASWACGDMPALNMMLARYDRPIVLPAVTDADGETVRRTDYGRLGLLTGEDGQIIARFIAYCSGQDAPLKTDSVSTPAYVQYFPSLDRELYARMTSEGYSEDQTYTVSDEDIAKAEAYVRWENAELAQVGELRAEVRPLAGAFAGRTLVAFYLDNAQLRALDAARDQFHVWAVEAVTAALILYAVFSLLLAVWVFRDARKRDFLPAMWGLLTLIGNVVAWLVYMLVRSRGVGSRCPRCGTALRSDFAYCPGLRARRPTAPVLPAAAPPRMRGGYAPTAARLCPNFQNARRTVRRLKKRHDGQTQPVKSPCARGWRPFRAFIVSGGGLKPFRFSGRRKPTDFDDWENR